VAGHLKILDVGVRHHNFLAAPYDHNTIVFDRNIGLLKHSTVILVHTIYLIISIKVVASGSRLTRFCKIPKESELGMKRKQYECVFLKKTINQAGHLQF